MNKRLFVAGIPFSTTPEELRALFSEYGNVIASNVIMDRETGRSKGFGFVEMETGEEAKNAISKLNESEYGGRKLIVSEARPKEEKRSPEGGFRRGGFRGGRRESFGGRREGGRGNFGRDGGDSKRGRFRGGRH